MDCSLGVAGYVGLYFHRLSVRHAELVKATLLLVLQSDSPQFYKNRTEANRDLGLCISIIPVAGLFFFSFR